MSHTRWFALLIGVTLAVGVWLRTRWPRAEAALPCGPTEVNWAPQAGTLVAQCGPPRNGSSAVAPAPMRLAIGLKLSLNRATEEELAGIKGVGRQLAKAVVDQRQKEGAFHRWDEVDKVKGVGPAKLKLLQEATSLEP